MKSFYVTLISGSSSHLYSNTSSKFINKLPIPLELHDNIEFGICELSYKMSMNNIPFMQEAMNIMDHSYCKPESSKTIFHKIHIPEGFYESESVFAQSLNKLIWEKIPRLNNIEIFTYEKVLRKFKAVAGEHRLSIHFSKSLGLLMGLGGEGIVGLKERQCKPLLLDMGFETGFDKGLTSMFFFENGVFQKKNNFKLCETIFIYCDLVFQQYSGDTFSNLLRMCPVRGGDNERVVERFERVHYLPLSKHHIPTMEVHIKTIEDEFVHLKDITYVKLHFREKKEN